MTKFCIQCGAGILADDRFCSKCGKEQRVNSSENLDNAQLAKRAPSKLEIAILIVVALGVVSLLSALGWTSFQTNQEGFNLSGAAGKDTEIVDGEESNVNVSSLDMEDILDSTSLARVKAMEAEFQSEKNVENKLSLAMSLATTFSKWRVYSKAAFYYYDAGKLTREKEEKYRLILKAANIYQDIKDFNKALVCYEEVIAAFEENVDARVDYALTLISSGKLMEGVTQMRKSTEIDPSHQKANLNLGILYAQINKNEEARSYWKKALDVDPSSEAGLLAKKLLKEYP